MPGTPVFSLYELDEPMDRTALLREFAALPARLADVVRGVPSSQLTARPDPDEWSAFEVVCHFRDVAVVYGLRFRWMVLNDDPFLPNYDEDRWVAECRDTPSDLERILGHIAASRADICGLLGNLRDDEWGCTGRHEVIGTVVLADYVAHEVAHERQHIEQLRAALGA